MMWAVTWFSVRPGLRNRMVSQCAASPMAPTMRRHSCSSTFLIARASIIGVMPSTHLSLASVKALSMLMSMKSTPSVWSRTPYRFISLTMASVNFFTCWRGGGGTGGALDPGIGPADVLRRDPRRMALDLEADVPLLEQDRRSVAAEERVPEAGLQPVPARRERAGHVPDVLVVHEEERAQVVGLHPLPSPLQPVRAEPIPVDALLPVDADGPEACHVRPLVTRCPPRRGC